MIVLCLIEQQGIFKGICSLPLLMIFSGKSLFRLKIDVFHHRCYIMLRIARLLEVNQQIEALDG